MKPIRRSALNVFSKVGFDYATTKEIARLSKVNESLIFCYFGDKSGVLSQLILQEIKSCDAEGVGYPHGKNP